MEENSKPTVQSQRRLNTKVQDIVKAEIVKLLDAGLIYAISDSPWVSPIHVVPKKGGITVIANKDNELIPTRTVTGWKMLERLSVNEYYCFLDGFSRVKSVNQKAITSSLSSINHVSNGESTKKRGCPQINPTAQDQYLIIEGIDG
ncbi:hypothetical protein Tco_0133096 [Tanacetum coccineum]